MLVSLIGLVVTAACQGIYGEVYWFPPDLLMRIINSGDGFSKARAGVFFLAAGFALTEMFENVCGNAVVGGNDLAGLFPRCLDVRRGSVRTFVAIWICQPWQLVNKAATFVSLLSSFSVSLSPIMGIVVVDFYILRKCRIQLSHLYRVKDTSYWYTRGMYGVLYQHGSVDGRQKLVNSSSRWEACRLILELWYNCITWHSLVGFFMCGSDFYLLNLVFPYPGPGQYDEVDVYWTFTAQEATKLGVVQVVEPQVLDGIVVTPDDKKTETEVIVEKSL